MKAIVYRRHGRPGEVCTLEDVPEPQPGPGEVRVRLQASPIDPADLLVLHGLYAVQPPLPATPGMEGAGVVDAVGEGVTDLRLGQAVLLPIRAGAWQEGVVVPAQSLLPLPDGIDPVQASMLRINPPTAELLVTEFGDTKPGTWILQNPGSGAVGQLVIQRARAHGLRTVNVVRNGARAAFVRELGGDAVVIDGPDLEGRVADAVQGAPLKVGLDAVGGEATHRLARCLAPGGTLVSYGAVSRKRSELGVDQTVFRSICLRGFWLFHWNREAGAAASRALLERMAQAVAAGSLDTRVAATYPLDQFEQALDHARAGDRFGRVLFTPTP